MMKRKVSGYPAVKLLHLYGVALFLMSTVIASFNSQIFSKNNPLVNIYEGTVVYIAADEIIKPESCVENVKKETQAGKAVIYIAKGTYIYEGKNLYEGENLMVYDFSKQKNHHKYSQHKSESVVKSKLPKKDLPKLSKQNEENNIVKFLDVQSFISSSKKDRHIGIVTSNLDTQKSKALQRDSYISNLFFGQGKIYDFKNVVFTRLNGKYYSYQSRPPPAIL